MPDRVQGMLAADLAAHRVDAGETQEQGLPIGERISGPLLSGLACCARRHKAAWEASPWNVTKGTAPVPLGIAYPPWRSS